MNIKFRVIDYGILKFGMKYIEWKWNVIFELKYVGIDRMFYC